MHKTALLAINYGVQSKTLALYLGVPEWKAAAIINAHKAAYFHYWNWAEENVSPSRPISSGIRRRETD
jgi:hypothetical protein